MATNGPIFEWNGRHPALDFVNTLDERLSATPVERLNSYAALTSFARQARLIDRNTANRLLTQTSQTEGKRVLRETLAFRELLYSVLREYASHRAPGASEAAALNDRLACARLHRRFIVRPEQISATWDEPLAPDRLVWELAVATEDLLLHNKLGRFRKCAASDCGTLFLDLSKTGRRKWCSMANCGNRNKVQRFRARIA
ncbi:MAG TPA: CGNR zinc finger domain-containing protein [Candidatus Udaeobacter sp.]|nr:CGNR zinc finger domain-containing protein [Candidatus Udaeobacter sp.]